MPKSIVIMVIKRSMKKALGQKRVQLKVHQTSFDLLKNNCKIHNNLFCIRAYLDISQMYSLQNIITGEFGKRHNFDWTSI